MTLNHSELNMNHSFESASVDNPLFAIIQNERKRNTVLAVKHGWQINWLFDIFVYKCDEYKILYITIKIAPGILFAGSG